MDSITQIEEFVERRIKKHLTVEEKDMLLGAFGTYIVAGGLFSNGEVNDVDVFVPSKVFNHLYSKAWDGTLKKLGWTLAHTTTNAQTYTREGKCNLQVCNYWKGHLKALLDAFDFTHCQCGVEYIKFKGGDSSTVYATDGWLLAKLTDTTEYVGSEYPLASLLRIDKYARRGLIPAWKRRIMFLQAMGDVLERGFLDYNDFKDQLAAVDINDVTGTEEAIRIFELMGGKVPWKKY